MSYTLYSFHGSGNSYKVRLLLALLGIEAETIELDLVAGDQHDPAFLALNSRAEVPVLVEGDKIFRDSASILIYLAGKHSRDDWWSRDVTEQARIVEWLAFAAGWIQFGVTTARAIITFGGAYNGVGKRTHPNTLKEAKIRSIKSLEILDRTLTGREWLTLERPTIADIAVFPYVALAPMGDIDLHSFPAVTAWIGRIRQLPGFFAMTGMESLKTAA